MLKREMQDQPGRISVAGPNYARFGLRGLPKAAPQVEGDWSILQIYVAPLTHYYVVSWMHPVWLVPAHFSRRAPCPVQKFAYFAELPARRKLATGAGMSAFSQLQLGTGIARLACKRFCGVVRHDVYFERIRQY